MLAIFIQVCYSFHVSDGPGKVRSIGRLRRVVQEMRAEEVEEIDRLVRKIMGE